MFRVRLATALLLLALALPVPAQARITATFLHISRLACEAGETAACEAVFLATGEVLGNFDPQEPLRRANIDCAAGTLRACTDRATMRIWLDETQSPQIYTDLNGGCVGGDGWACNMLSNLTDFGINDTQAAWHTEQQARATACEKGDQQACVDAVWLAEAVSGEGVDASRNRNLLETACAAGFQRACTMLGFRLAEPDFPGYPQDLTLAAILSRRGCDLGNPVACWNLSIAYNLGEGVPEDWQREQEYLARACKMGIPEGCDEIGYENFWERDDPGMVLRAACTAGDPGACFALSNAVVGRTGDEVQHARDMRRFCVEGGLPEACGFASAYLFEAGDDIQAYRFASAACELEDANGCTIVGNLYDLGRGVPENDSLAVIHFARACEGGETIGCFNEANMLYGGFGVPTDKPMAIAIYEVSCRDGYDPSCSRLRELSAAGESQAATALARLCGDGGIKDCEGP